MGKRSTIGKGKTCREVFFKKGEQQEPFEEQLKWLWEESAHSLPEAQDKI